MRGDCTDANEARLRDCDQLNFELAKLEGELNEALEKSARLPELETRVSQLEGDIRVAREDAANAKEENERLKFDLITAELTITGFK